MILIFLELDRLLKKRTIDTFIVNLQNIEHYTEIIKAENLNPLVTIRNKYETHEVVKALDIQNDKARVTKLYTNKYKTIY